MLTNGIGSGLAVCTRALMLLIGAVAILVTTLPSPALANDPRAGEAVGTAIVEKHDTGPQSTAGAKDIRVQRDAFWELATTQRKVFLAGKATADLLLDYEHWVLAADRMCAATAWERVRACQASRLRIQQICMIYERELAAGQNVQAEVLKVAHSLDEVNRQLKEDIDEALGKAVPKP